MENKLFDSINIEKIEQIAKIVSDNELSEITVSVGDCNLTIKGKKCPPAPPVMPVPMGITAPVQSASAPIQTVAEPVQQETDGNVVKSPIVGTFYQSPSPDKPPFVKVGDKVKKGDIIMIIESMKLMNEVQSEFDGTVEKILVSDGQPVEFDQPIMIIK
ncbi:MAG: acetyl-CoA carboxylase biotin carboxyl carrier protein [Ruminococcus sp.]|nr:acetyl-CoA carboxylase biotin carboxyl carrier protein [Ruminococcus sp.]